MTAARYDDGAQIGVEAAAAAGRGPVRGGTALVYHVDRAGFRVVKTAPDAVFSARHHAQGKEQG